MRPVSFSNSIDSEGWESLSRMLIAFPIDLDNQNNGLLRIKKELGLMKHVLFLQLVTFDGSNCVDASFFVGAEKSVARMEKKLDTHGIKNQRFVLFLKMLLLKLRKQKLLVKKHMEIQQEFCRMKKVVEHANPL